MLLIGTRVVSDVEPGDNGGEMGTTVVNQVTRAATSTVPAAERSRILMMARRVLDAEADAIADAARRLDDGFVAAVHLLLRTTGRVCVTGMGKAGLVGQKIQSTLSSTGTPAYCLHPAEALHGDLGMVRPDDVVVALTKSGSSELLELLPRLRELGCAVILLTAAPTSRAARHADCVLHIGETPEACPLGLAPSSSTAAMLALGDALALAVMELKDVQPAQYASYHPGGALGRFLMRAREVMRTGPDCPRVPVGATVGDGLEAMSRAPRRAGAVLVVESDGRLAGVLTHGDLFRLVRDGVFSLDRPVAEVMTRNPKFLHAEDRVADGLELMKKHGIDELPVVGAAHDLMGLIDIQDLLARGFSTVEGDGGGETPPAAAAGSARDTA